jgi:hypothetical protein
MVYIKTNIVFLDIIYQPVFSLSTQHFGDWIVSPSSDGYLRKQNIVTCRLKAGILETALFPRQRTRSSFPPQRTKIVGTLRDNVGIGTVTEGVHYRVLQEPI